MPSKKRKAKDGRTPKRLRIDVLEQDIERAHVNDSYKCVVAQAIARTVKTAGRIEVDTQSIRFTVDGERRVYLTPYAVQGYVIAFDAGDPIEPFSFQINDPSLARRRIRTEAGKAADLAGDRARRAAKKSQAEPRGGAKPTEVPARDKSEPSEAARAAYEAVRVAYDYAPATMVERGRKPTPRVFKRKLRTYGHRLLRINQESGGGAA